MTKMINDRMRNPESLLGEDVTGGKEVTMWNTKAKVIGLIPLHFAKKLVRDGKGYVETTSDIVYTN